MAIARNRAVNIVLRRAGATSGFMLFVAKAAKQAKVSTLKQAQGTMKAAATQWAALTGAQKKPFLAAAAANSAKRAALRKQLTGASPTGLFAKQSGIKFTSFSAYSKAVSKQWKALSGAQRAAYSKKAAAQNEAAEALLAKLSK
jgi:hypothetical protein